MTQKTGFPLFRSRPERGILDGFGAKFFCPASAPVLTPITAPTHTSNPTPTLNHVNFTENYKDIRHFKEFKYILAEVFFIQTRETVTLRHDYY